MTKHLIEPFRIDDSRMPLRLGSALRVPSYAYPYWGIPLGAYRIESDVCYTSEWAAGSPRQMQYVIDSVLAAGFGNNSNILRDSNARVVANRVRQLAEAGHDIINYTDIGAGVSTVNAFDAIDDKLKERVFITLVEPSEERVEAAAVDLDKRGLVRGRNYRVLVVPDQHLLALMKPDSQDIISYVAVLHHHSYIDTPLAIARELMKPEGIIVVADWHNPEWEHPNRVYTALSEDFDPDEFGWETMGEDLAAFAKAYPKALEPAPPLSPLDEASYREIRGFWKGWSRVKKAAIEKGEFDENDEILMLEAHRPVERQNETMAETGFRPLNERTQADLIACGAMMSNPNPLLDTSRLLMTTVAEK